MESALDRTGPSDARTVLSLVACILALAAGYALAVVFASAGVLVATLVFGSRYGVERPIYEDVTAFLLVLRFTIPVVAVVALPGWLVMRGMLVLLAMRSGRPRTEAEVALFACAGVLCGLWTLVLLQLDSLYDGRGASFDSEALRNRTSFFAAGLAGGVGAWLGERVFGGCARPGPPAGSDNGGADERPLKEETAR